MKHSKGKPSSKCISAVLLKAASARKMDKKDDEADEPEKQERQQAQTPKAELHQSQNPVAHSTRSLPADDTKVDGGSGISLEVKQTIQPPQNADRDTSLELANEGPTLSGQLYPKLAAVLTAAGSITGESAQSTRGTLRDDVQHKPNSDEHGHTSNSRSESRPRIHIKDISDIPEESAESLVSARELTGSKSPSRSSKSRTESIEGEFVLGEQENVGPTLGQYRYQMTREDYDALSKSLLEKTINTLIHLGEIHKTAYVDSQPPTMRAPVPPRLSQETAEAQLFVLDKEMKSIARRINESKREQAYTLQRINDLEVKMFKKQGADYIREIMTKVPNGEDLKDMQQIRQLMLERKRLQKEIEKLNMEMSSMNKAMANADVIISDCAAIKKPRRVVICTRTQNHSLAREESSSREVIGRGETPNRGRRSSPPTTDASDLAVTSSSGGSIAELQEPAEQSNLPETIESDEVQENSEDKGNESNEKKAS